MEEKLEKIVNEELVGIHKTWRTWHTRILAGFVAFTLLAEVIMYFVMSGMGWMDSSPQKYFIKYILVPSLCGIFDLIVCQLANDSTKISETAKNYIVSIATVFCAFYVTAIHGLFLPIYSIVVIPIIFSSFYSNMKITAVCSVLSALTLLLNAYVIRWDDSKSYDPMYNIDISLFVVLLLCVYTASSYGIRLEKKKTDAMYQRERERIMLYNLSRRDELTGLYNRFGLRDFFQKLQDRKVEDYLFVMLDIDSFKAVNDTLGHSVGDVVLEMISKILLDRETKDWVPFRFGGDEFCILIRNCEKKDIKDIIAQYNEILNRFVTTLPPDVKALGISISAGVSKKNPDITISQLIKNADQALYKSKDTDPKTILFFEE